MRLWRIQVCTVDKCLVFLLSLKYIMHRWFWQEDWWIFWSVGFYFAWEVSCVESSLTGYSVCWKGSSSLDWSSGLFSKESFLITVEGEKNNCEGLCRHKRLQSRRFALCSSSWRLWDGGRWKQWVAWLRGSVCVCACFHTCAGCGPHPPSELMLFSFQISDLQSTSWLCEEETHQLTFNLTVYYSDPLN